MGINVNIYVHKKDLFNLLEDVFDFSFLLKCSIMRYSSFLNMFNLEENRYPDGITSKELLIEIAKSNSQIKNRETWISILDFYDLFFLPDTTTPKDSNYIEIYTFYGAMISYTEEHLKELLDKYAEYMGAVGELNEAKSGEQL